MTTRISVQLCQQPIRVYNKWSWTRSPMWLLHVALYLPRLHSCITTSIINKHDDTQILTTYNNHLSLCVLRISCRHLTNGSVSRTVFLRDKDNYWRILVHEYVCTYVYMYVCACVRVCMYVCMYVLCVRTYVCMYACVYLCMQLCMSVCMPRKCMFIYKLWRHSWVVRTLTSYWGAAGSNAGRVADNPDLHFCDFPSFLQENSGIAVYKWPRQLPFTSFSIHNLFIHLLSSLYRKLCPTNTGFLRTTALI
jgi:hypothetical protein